MWVCQNYNKLLFSILRKAKKHGSPQGNRLVCERQSLRLVLRSFTAVQDNRKGAVQDRNDAVQDDKKGAEV